jgi:hypothetical protein
MSSNTRRLVALCCAALAAALCGRSARPDNLPASFVVDEAGAETSGATAVEGSYVGIPQQQPPKLDFIADRPFVSLLEGRDVPEWPVMVALIRSP